MPEGGAVEQVEFSFLHHKYHRKERSTTNTIGSFVLSKVPNIIIIIIRYGCVWKMTKHAALAVTCVQNVGKKHEKHGPSILIISKQTSNRNMLFCFFIFIFKHKYTVF